MKKRFPAIILALALCVGLAIPAFAEEATIFDWITISDYATSDEYTSIDYPDLGPLASSFYYIGDLVYSDGLSEFVSILLPSDATITLQASNYCVRAEWLKKLEGDSWEVQSSSEKVYDPASGSDTWDRARFEEEFPGATYVMIGLGTELWESEIPPMAFMFVDTDSEPEPTPSFTDVDAKDWYAEHVAWAVETGITTGKTSTKFAPKDYCTHDQILTFLYRAQRDDGTAPSGSDMALAIEWAKEEGMINDSFDPKADCTRADAVNYIWQAFGSKEAETEASFPDVADDADYAAAVSWAVEKGIVDGYPDGTFGPNVVCNRGTIVTLLHRAEIRLNADN